jgi:hypothetical protein
MKYETPKLTALTLAIDAIQNPASKITTAGDSEPNHVDAVSAYEDWE